MTKTENSEDDSKAIDALMQDIDLSSASSIATYTNLTTSGARSDALAELFEQSPVSLLAGKIAEVVARLDEADPQKVTVKAGWLARFSGADLENKVRYQVSRKAVDTLLEEADRLADRVMKLVEQIDAAMAEHFEDVSNLRLRIAAGRLYLDRNPTAGMPIEGEMSFDNPRERFERRLASMSALLSSHEMNTAQLKLSRAQAIDMVDRYHETSTVLVPVWRHHTLAISSNLNNTPEAIALAAKAQESLINSLSALKGIA